MAGNYSNTTWTVTSTSSSNWSIVYDLDYPQYDPIAAMKKKFDELVKKHWKK